MILMDSQLQKSGFVSTVSENKECVKTANFILHLHDEFLYEVIFWHFLVNICRNVFICKYNVSNKKLNV